MGDSDIIIMLGVGYLLYKQAEKTVKQAKIWVEEEVIEPSYRLRAGTSVHYSPYSKRYFTKDYSREGSLGRWLFGKK